MKITDINLKYLYISYIAVSFFTLILLLVYPKYHVYSYEIVPLYLPLTSIIAFTIGAKHFSNVDEIKNIIYLLLSPIIIDLVLIITALIKESDIYWGFGFTQDVLINPKTGGVMLALICGSIVSSIYKKYKYPSSTIRSVTEKTRMINHIMYILFGTYILFSVAIIVMFGLGGGEIGFGLLGLLALYLLFATIFGFIIGYSKITFIKKILYFFIVTIPPIVMDVNMMLNNQIEHESILDSFEMTSAILFNVETGGLLIAILCGFVCRLILNKIRRFRKFHASIKKDMR